MVAILNLVVFAALSSEIFGLSTAQLSAEVIDYTISLIEHFAEEDYGTFDCWFYEQEGARGVLSPIVTSERLALIPKRVLQDSGPTPVDRKPAMLVIFCTRYLIPDVRYFLGFSILSVETKIVAFYSTDEQCSHAAFVFEKVLMPNVIFMPMDSLKVRFVVKFKNERRQRLGFVPFNEVFIDQTSDLNGYVVKISTSKFSRSEWVNAAATKMNGSYQYYEFTCEGSFDECFRPTRYYNTSVMYDICMDKFFLNIINENLLPSMIPTLSVIAVHRGRELTVLEKFMAPFRTDLWIALLLLMISCSALMLIRPIRPQNNLILLALCGIERRGLSAVSRPERFAVISLIILFFLVTSAYESKLMALMTSKPHVPNIHTLDDLVRANITIRDRDLDSTYGNCSDPRMEQIFKYDPSLSSLWDPQDKTRAYIGPLNHMRTIANLPAYYDSVNKRSHFIILDQAFRVSVLAYVIEFRSALKCKFSKYQMAYFESGLLQRTYEENPFVIIQTLHQNLIRDTEEVSFDVGISELLPAWYVLLVGFSLAGFVLVIEMAYVSIVLTKSRVRKLMMKRRRAR